MWIPWATIIVLWIITGAVIVWLSLMGASERRRAKIDLALALQELRAIQESEIARMYAICEMAIENVKATTLAERQSVVAQRQVNDVQLQYLRDTMAKQAKAHGPAQEAPKTVRTDDGRQVNFEDFEWS